MRAASVFSVWIGSSTRCTCCARTRISSRLRLSRLQSSDAYVVCAMNASGKAGRSPFLTSAGLSSDSVAFQGALQTPNWVPPP
ncbi:Uncharacterised protein [Mycobacteroides abscessus subsp. abscessus]|nr:Uncharacterised protein [Mycobacteroides abscessus subsp. abscessus]